MIPFKNLKMDSVKDLAHLLQVVMRVYVFFILFAFVIFSSSSSP
jgi:hypothetical protein